MLAARLSFRSALFMGGIGVRPAELAEVGCFHFAYEQRRAERNVARALFGGV